MIKCFQKNMKNREGGIVFCCHLYFYVKKFKWLILNRKRFRIEQQMRTNENKSIQNPL